MKTRILVGKGKETYLLVKMMGTGEEGNETKRREDCVKEWEGKEEKGRKKKMGLLERGTEG